MDTYFDPTLLKHIGTYDHGNGIRPSKLREITQFAEKTLYKHLGDLDAEGLIKKDKIKGQKQGEYKALGDELSKVTKKMAKGEATFQDMYLIQAKQTKAMIALSYAKTRVSAASAAVNVTLPDASRNVASVDQTVRFLTKVLALAPNLADRSAIVDPL